MNRKLCFIYIETIWIQVRLETEQLSDDSSAQEDICTPADESITLRSRPLQSQSRLKSLHDLVLLDKNRRSQSSPSQRMGNR